MTPNCDGVGDSRHSPRLRKRLQGSKPRRCGLRERRTPSSDEESGRGLTLVTLLADAWGAEERKAGVGKAVWFELGLTH